MAANWFVSESCVRGKLSYLAQQPLLGENTRQFGKLDLVVDDQRAVKKSSRVGHDCDSYSKVADS